RDAVAAVNAFDRLDDVFAALLAVVVGADRNRLDLRLRADHMFQGGAEFDGQPPMGNNYEADHRYSPLPLTPPHERARFMTTRPPKCKGLSPYLGSMLHCGNTRPKSGLGRVRRGRWSLPPARLIFPRYQQNWPFAGLTRSAASIAPQAPAARGRRSV